MRITRIELGKFRGFDEADIELKPLTVLLGANSSGKSSFGHALAAMSHAQWLHGATNKASLTPGPNATTEWPVDLATLADLRKEGASGPVQIGLETSEGWARWGFGQDPSSRNPDDLSISYIEYPTSLGNTAPARAETPLFPTATSAIAVNVPPEQHRNVFL